MSTIFISGVDATSLDAAIANQLAASKDQVARLNADEKVRYDGLWNNFVLNVESGQRDNSNPPQPPMAWELSPAPPKDGSAPNYFVFYAKGNTPICPMPDVPNNHMPVDPATLPKGVYKVGKNFYGKWFSVLAGDTFPFDLETPPVQSADGITGVFKKFPAPVGPGWYLQVA